MIGGAGTSAQADVVSGGGGQLLYDLTTCPAGHPQRIAGEAIHHFLVLEQSEEAISVEVVDVTDGVIDQFEVPSPNAPPRGPGVPG